ncbi:hypothetical protein [Saccharopolyspora rosea]|uniref:hypothetical protein n=1 Tax=Saccharopolyspora rosea TaxID=524884 RepID=UPI0021D8DE71|nr:hypothetical protein [Saccharopolyspora rosea]
MSALGELIEALRLVEERLDQARGQLAAGRREFDATRAALARLDPEHPENVVPPGFARADDQLERTQELIEHVQELLRTFASRL